MVCCLFAQSVSQFGLHYDLRETGSIHLCTNKGNLCKISVTCNSSFILVKPTALSYNPTELSLSLASSVSNSPAKNSVSLVRGCTAAISVQISVKEAVLSFLRTSNNDFCHVEYKEEDKPW